ncbi:MAG: hypothetical protein WBY44_01100 [Bryobacteraceae bacterium]
MHVPLHRRRLRGLGDDPVLNMSSITNSWIGSGSDAATSYGLDSTGNLWDLTTGELLSTNVTGSAANPLASLTASSVLPLLLIGGGLVVALMMARK